ncbi:MAG: extensin family protein [Sandaracinaceae bacterium]|nr:extensin family protein [Sandaracinaceae bacterium]
MLRAVVLSLVVVTGCRGVDLSASRQPPGAPVRGVPPAGGDAGTLDASMEPSISIAGPADGSVFVRDAIVEGEWAAQVTFTGNASGVSRVELYADETFLLGEAQAGSWSIDALFRADGVRAISARGLSATGEELVRDEIAITIEAPGDTSCHAMLDALGLDWAPAGATRGIADPVRVQPTIDGVSFRYTSSASATAMLMDCELGVRLHQLAQILHRYDIVEVEHIGIYNYRCIGGGDPDVDGCTPSMHAYAQAIDLHAFLAANGTHYDTVEDWAITTRADPCPIASSSDQDRVLKEIACAMYEERVFEIILTPNYNADHRNHFHVDLTDGSHYLGQSVGGVDPLLPGLDF